MKKAETKLTQSVVGIAVCILLDALCLILGIEFKSEGLISVAWAFVAATFWFSGSAIYWCYQALKG